MPENARGEPLEIERKFLIRRPPEELLRAESLRCIRIRQTYLLPGPQGENRRVRCSRFEGQEHWYYTEKLRLDDLTRIEREREITPCEAQELLREADGKRQSIEKTRWCVPYGGHTLEIDLFPFWERQAFCEVEMGSAEEETPLPPWMELIREVTADRNYTNSALALNIPPED
ncbi:MAG: hypothetical protein IKQ69_05740 [Oscillospiraceae bacterium]|nr:hypothetical protein [Oscillospiraceae bacterium]